jgi:hypothetical protein
MTIQHERMYVQRTANFIESRFKPSHRTSMPKFTEYVGIQ